MRTAVLLLMALAATACSDRSAALRTARYAVTSPIVLSGSNVTELNGSGASLTVEVVDGNTRVTIVADPSWPIQNAFRGFQDFFYNAPSSTYPIIHVQDGACDADVIAGWACDWHVNFDGTNADSFGTFASESNQTQGATAGASGVTFTIQGTPDFLVNDHGARFAVHAQFDGGCSGWLSDGTAGTMASNASCVPVQQPSCSITVEPAALIIARGSTRSIEVMTSATGVSTPLTIGILPSPPPPGLGFVIVPNPVTPGESALLTISVDPTAPVDSYVLTLTGAGGGASCSAQLALTVEERSGCSCQ